MIARKKLLPTPLIFPHLLSALRLVLGFVLLGMAWRGDAGVFIGVLIFAFFLDFIDGPIARRWHQVSKPGPIIDSYADFSVYMAFLIGAWWLRPDIIHSPFSWRAGKAVSSGDCYQCPGGPGGNGHHPVAGPAMFRCAQPVNSAETKKYLRRSIDLAGYRINIKQFPGKCACGDFAK